MWRTVRIHFFSITGTFSFINCKALRHEIESVKIIYLDEDAVFISSRALMITQVSGINFIRKERKKDALNTFYLRLYGVGHMVERKPAAATWTTLSD